MNVHSQYERASAKSYNIQACARTEMPLHPMDNMKIYKDHAIVTLSFLVMRYHC